MGFNLVYTTSSSPPVLTDKADIAAHEQVVQGKQEPLSNSGSVCRIVDFAPGYTCVMYRTKSLDYGVVLEGEGPEMVLDGGEVQKLSRSDVCVQRATMHRWRNTSATGWARMLFVSLGDAKIVVGGKELGDEGYVQ
ncbi:MAG: hypothetical protein M1818_003208 [Claussenomyces sp. TS43310]|nr:MAG: hypothetical protein M1818_003208 [Claussenomyces sp. TS43310]